MLNKNNKWLIILTLTIYLTVVIPLASSQELQIPVYEQGEARTLSVPCTNNGNFCPSGTNCSSTIISPTQNVLVNEQVMSKNGGVYEISLLANQTEEIGFYEMAMTCTNGVITRTRLLQFEITPNGERPTTAKGILYFGLIILLFLTFGLFVWGIFKTESIWARVGFMMFAYLLLIAVSFIAFNLALDFLTSTPFLVSMFRIIFYVLLYGLLPVLIGLFAYGLLMALKIKELQGLVNKGLSLDEASEFNKRKKKKRRF